MKLFQRLLVAPAALGLLAPVVANANEVNLNEIANYSDIESIEIKSFDNNESNLNPLLAGGEGLMDDHDHGSDSFSTTTSASFSVDMAIGAVDGNTTETVGTAYGYQIDLSTSFTGEDALSVSLDAGSGAAPLAELDLNSSGDGLIVDGVTYTFPLGDKTTVLVGDSTDGSALYTVACAYGGFTNTLDDCGNGNSAFTSPTNGATISASYDIGGGWTGALGYAGEGTGGGLMTKAGTDMYGANVAYTADSYGVSFTYGSIEDAANSYATGTNTPEYKNETSYYGFNAYWTPETTGAIPSISYGYEIGRVANTPTSDTTQWFLGVQWDEVGAGTAGAAFGTVGAITDGAEELQMYELFYSYTLNDGMTITPAIFVKETAGVADSETGYVVKTSFSF